MNKDFTSFRIDEIRRVARLSTRRIAVIDGAIVGGLAVIGRSLVRFVAAPGMPQMVTALAAVGASLLLFIIVTRVLKSVAMIIEIRSMLTGVDEAFDALVASGEIK